MSRETEKILGLLKEYMVEHQDEIDGNVSGEDLAQRFMAEYNASLQLDNALALPQSADDFIDLAESAGTKKKKLEYLSKALELEPDNLDALRMAAEVNEKRPEELLAKFSALLEKGASLMERDGYFRDFMGDFWGVLETRPYMRLRHAYFKLLVECGMMGKAVGEAKELLRLCSNDNMGVRYELMHLYAYIEDEDAALALHKEYDQYEESQLLLPLAVLYYKKENYELSLQYLHRLAKANKDTKKFLRIMARNDADELANEMNPYGYCPFTIEELIQEYCMNHYLFDGVRFFFDWANRNLKKTVKATVTSK